MKRADRERLLQSLERRPIDPGGTAELFDIDPDVGGRAVNESDTRKARGAARRDDRRAPCPRCGEPVQPGPHTRRLATGTVICREESNA